MAAQRSIVRVAVVQSKVRTPTKKAIGGKPALLGNINLIKYKKLFQPKMMASYNKKSKEEVKMLMLKSYEAFKNFRKERQLEVMFTPPSSSCFFELGWVVC